MPNILHDVMVISAMDTTVKQDAGWKKWCLLCWAFVEICLFSGIHLGWGSLVFILKDEDIYANLCPGGGMIYHETNTTSLVEGTTHHQQLTAASIGPKSASTSATSEPSGNKDNACKPQDDKLALCFAICMALFSFTAAVMGHVNYKYGTRIYRLVGFIIFTGGAMMMAFASVEVPWLIFPGLAMIGIGGLPLLVSNTQIANMFDKGRSTIVVGLNAAYIVSSGVQLLVKLLHENGVSRQKTYIAIAIIHSLTLVSTFRFLPKTFIPTHKDAVQHSSSLLESPKDKPDIQTGISKQGSDGKIGGNKHVLLKCVKHPLFITHCIWFCVLQLKILCFLGTFNVYLNRTLKGDKDRVSYFTDIWLYILTGGALPASLMAGSIYDWQKKVHQNKTNNHSTTYQALIPAVLPHAAGSLLFVLFSVLTLIPSTALIYPMFVLMTLSRAFLYGLALAFLSAVFPSEYFGFLFGLMYIVGGLFCFLQYAFFAWTESYLDGPLHTDMTLLVLVSISFIHPFYIWLTCKRSDKNIA